MPRLLILLPARASVGQPNCYAGAVGDRRRVAQNSGIKGSGEALWTLTDHSPKTYCWITLEKRSAQEHLWAHVRFGGIRTARHRRFASPSTGSMNPTPQKPE